jgi:hypothetical protein
MEGAVARDFFEAVGFRAFSLVAVAMVFPPLLCVADERYLKHHRDFCRELFP